MVAFKPLLQPFLMSKKLINDMEDMKTARKDIEGAKTAIFEMKMSLDGVTEENVSEFEDTSVESVQNETQRGREKEEGHSVHGRGVLCCL